jgi:hypothetical protein
MLVQIAGAPRRDQTPAFNAAVTFSYGGILERTPRNRRQKSAEPTVQRPANHKLAQTFGFLCYNLIHGAWTDALVVGPPEQDWIWVCFLSINPPKTVIWGGNGGNRRRYGQ